MSRMVPWSSLMAFVAMVLLAVSTVYGHPVPGAEGHKSQLQPRSPRLIPDTANYLADVFGTLGILGCGKNPGNFPYVKGRPQNQPAAMTQGNNVAVTPSPIPTPTTTSNTVSYTYTYKNGKNNHKPIENIQIMSGYSNKQGLTTEDVRLVLGALYKTLADRFRNMVDSSDELTLR